MMYELKKRGLPVQHEVILPVVYEDDDCVVFSAGGVRIEVSLHATAADCLRAREDTIRQAKERGREMALAVAKPGGSA
jgi:hypothetical protein